MSYISPDPVQEAIRDLFNVTMGDTAITSDFAVEECQEAAIELIIMAGFDCDDSDAFGFKMGDRVQRLLEVVMAMCPQLRERIIGQADDVRIVAEVI